MDFWYWYWCGWIYSNRTRYNVHIYTCDFVKSKRPRTKTKKKTNTNQLIKTTTTNRPKVNTACFGQWKFRLMAYKVVNKVANQTWPNETHDRSLFSVHWNLHMAIESRCIGILRCRHSHIVWWCDAIWLVQKGRALTEHAYHIKIYVLNTTNAKSILLSNVVCFYISSYVSETPLLWCLMKMVLTGWKKKMK